MQILLTSFTDLLADQFVHTTWPEWIGVLSGFTCIYLAAKENVWNWPISIISVIAYAWVFFDATMYGDMALQFYFLFTAFYGWYYWIQKKDNTDHREVTTLKARDWLLISIAVAVLSGLLGLFLENFTNTDVPYADGFCTALSFVAQILLTRKILENWILWIIVDLCYVPLYIYKHLNLSAVFYGFLIVIAFMGYLDWRKTYRGQSH